MCTCIVSSAQCSGRVVYGSGVMAAIFECYYYYYYLTKEVLGEC